MSTAPFVLGAAVMVLIGGGLLAWTTGAGVEAGGMCAMCCTLSQPSDEQPQTPATPAQAGGSPRVDANHASVRGTVSVARGWSLARFDPTRVVVFLSSSPELDAVPTGIDHVTVAQKDKAFVPNFTVIPRGTTVEFPNWDDYDHNVFSRSKAAPAFDLDRYPKGMSKSRVFEKTGVVQVFCNIHPQMRAMIYVAPNRWFSRADADGKFEIKNVPPGKYQVVAWHERCGERQQDIVVTAAGAPETHFSLEESRSQIMENTPRREEGYGVERGLGIKRERLRLPVVPDAHPAKDPPK